MQKKKARDLSEALKGKRDGWIAVDKDNIVVSVAKSFAEICKKTEKLKGEITLVPVAKDYSGFAF